MRRKLFAVLLLLLFAVCGAFVISACNEDEKQGRMAGCNSFRLRDGRA